jgi:hypothetical protein
VTSLLVISKNSPGKSAPNGPADSSPVAASAASSSANTPVPHATASAPRTTSAMARAVTAGIVRNWITGRGAAPLSSARRLLTAACVSSSCRSIRSRCAAISRFRCATSGAESTAAIESSGMPRSRSRLITWAEATCPVS